MQEIDFITISAYSIVVDDSFGERLRKLKEKKKLIPLDSFHYSGIM